MKNTLMTDWTAPFSLNFEYSFLYDSWTVYLQRYIATFFSFCGVKWCHIHERHQVDVNLWKLWEHRKTSWFYTAYERSTDGNSKDPKVYPKSFLTLPL